MVQVVSGGEVERVLKILKREKRLGKVLKCGGADYGRNPHLFLPDSLMQLQSKLRRFLILNSCLYSLRVVAYIY